MGKATPGTFEEVLGRFGEDDFEARARRGLSRKKLERLRGAEKAGKMPTSQGDRDPQTQGSFRAQLNQLLEVPNKFRKSSSPAADAINERKGYKDLD